MDCWEFKNCPAYPGSGNECWKVTGTMCGGVEQEDVENKIQKCRQCEYYQSPDCKKF